MDKEKSSLAIAHAVKRRMAHKASGGEVEAQKPYSSGASYAKEPSATLPMMSSGGIVKSIMNRMSAMVDAEAVDSAEPLPEMDDDFLSDEADGDLTQESAGDDEPAKRKSMISGIMKGLHSKK